MQFELTEEERLIRDTAAQFVRREMLTREKDYLRQEELFLPPGDPPRRVLAADVAGHLRRVASRLGLWALEFPPAPDEEPMSAVCRVLVRREFGRTILPFEPAHIPGILAPTPHAAALIDGTRSMGLAFGGVHATGRPDGALPRCRETADGYVFVDQEAAAFDAEASLYLVPAWVEGAGRIALFAIPAELPGVFVGDFDEMTSDSLMTKLRLQECAVPRQDCIGGEAEVLAVVASEQLDIAARCLGMAARCLADTIDHARGRVTFGRPLAERQAVQWMLADLSLELSAATWLTLEAAWRMDRREAAGAAAALAKKKAARTAFQAADTAIQIHGGYGVCKEFPYEGFYRDARLLRLLFGREAELDRSAGERFIQAADTGT